MEKQIYLFNNASKLANNLPENKWRKIYKVDAKRVAHFINHGGNVELPSTLRRKYGDTDFVREKKLAKGFLLNKIEELESESEIFSQKAKPQEQGKPVPDTVRQTNKLENSFDFAKSKPFPTNRQFKIELQERVKQAAKEATERQRRLAAAAATAACGKV